jgi:hypothetical protein
MWSRATPNFRSQVKRAVSKGRRRRPQCVPPRTSTLGDHLGIGSVGHPRRQGRRKLGDAIQTVPRAFHIAPGCWGPSNERCTDGSLVPSASQIIQNDRYPLSPRIVALKEILGQLRPEPEREPPLSTRRHYELPSKGRYSRRR